MKRIKYRDQFFYKYAIMSIVRHKKCLYNTLYTRYAGIVQRFVSTIEFFHGDHNAMQSYTLRSESDFFWAQRWTQDKRVIHNKNNDKTNLIRLK